MEVEEGEMGEEDAPAPWYVKVKLKKEFFYLLVALMKTEVTLYFQFHPHRLQLVQEILDAAGLLQEPRAVLR